MDFKNILAVTLIFFYILSHATATESLECNGKCKCYNREMDCSAAQMQEPIFDSKIFKRKIKIIDFRRNKITGLEFTSYNFIYEEMEEMIFDFNKIKYAKMCKIGRSFPNLKKLSVINNRIEKIKKGDLLFVNNLQTLDLGNNQISEIDDGSFFSQEKLEKLLLDGNQITLLKSLTFFGLSNLKILSIKRNSLTLLHKKWFEYLPNLSELSVKSNKIQYLKPFDMKWPKSLTKIDLSNNRLEYMPNLPSMENITNAMIDHKEWFFDLTKNPVSCECVISDHHKNVNLEVESALCGISVECSFGDNRSSQWVTKGTCHKKNGTKFMRRIKNQPICQPPQLELNLVTLDDQVTELQCNSSGNPIPTVAIIRTNNGNVISTELRPNFASTMITRNQTISEFVCTARNIFGHVNSSKWLLKEAFVRYNISKLQNATDKCLPKVRNQETICPIGTFTDQRQCESMNPVLPLIVFTTSMVSTITVTCYFLWMKCREILHLNNEEEQEKEEEENYDQVAMEMQY